jgi:hypothetical protein
MGRTDLSDEYAPESPGLHDLPTSDGIASDGGPHPDTKGQLVVRLNDQIGRSHSERSIFVDTNCRDAIRSFGCSLAPNCDAYHGGRVEQGR